MAVTQQSMERLTNEMDVIRQSSRCLTDEDKRIANGNECITNENERLAKMVEALRQSLDGRITAVVDAKVSSLPQAQSTILCLSEALPEGLEARLAVHLEECKNATRAISSDTVQPLSEELRCCVDKVDALGTTAEDTRKASVSVQESLQSQQQSIELIQDDLNRLCSAFGKDPAACVQNLIDDSVQPVTDWVTPIRTGIAGLCGRVDGHDVRLDRQGGEIQENNRRLDTHGGRFANLSQQLTDVDTQHDAWCDGFDARLRGFGKHLENHDGRIRGVDGRVDRVDTRLDAHDGRIEAQCARFDSHETRLNAQATRSGTHDTRLNAHDVRFRTQDTRLDAHDGRFNTQHTQSGLQSARTDAHSKQLEEIRGQLDEYQAAATGDREEVARIQADLVEVLGSLGNDEQEVTSDSTFSQASFRLRSRFRYYDESMTRLSSRITEVDETLAEEQENMQAGLDRLYGAFGDDPKAILNAAISEAVRPLATRLDRHDKVTEGVHGRLNEQNETLATLQSDHASVQAMIDNIGSALDGNPVAAAKRVNDLLRDLEEKYAALRTRLGGCESSSSNARQAISSLQADVSKILVAFGDDPTTAIRNAFTEFIKSMQSRIKYLEDKQSGQQDRADKDQAAIAAVRKDISAPRAEADLARLTRAVGTDPRASVPLADTVKHLCNSIACQQTEVTSLCEGVAEDKERIIHLEGGLGNFVALFGQRPQPMGEALRRNAHETFHLEETTEPPLPVPIVLVQDVKTGEGAVVSSEGEHDDSGLKGALDEGLSPAVLTHSLGMDGISDIADGKEGSTPDEPLTMDEASISVVAPALTPVEEGRKSDGITEHDSISPMEACEDAINEDGCGLSSYVRYSGSLLL